MAAKRTLKIRRYFLCVRRDDVLEILDERRKYHFARRLKEKHPGSFLVFEAIVVKRDELDYGCVYWCDEKGNSLDLEKETGQRV